MPYTNEHAAKTNALDKEEGIGKSSSTGIEYKTFKFNIEKIEETKSKSDEMGLIKGYASTFGNIDLGDDVVQRGAFLKSIEKYQKEGDKIPICFQHSLMDIVGGCDPARMREDEKGLYIEGEIYKKTLKGCDVYELAKQKVLNKMSIGYSVDACDYDEEIENGKSRNIRLLKEVSLYEISMVSHPMNQQARISDVKTEKNDISISKDEIIQIISDRSVSLNDKKSSLCKILRKNVLSWKAAEFIMSFIFKDNKKTELYENAKSIFNDILTQQKNNGLNDTLNKAKKEFEMIIK